MSVGSYEHVVLLVEDGKSGYQFFRAAFPEADCRSAGGNSAIVAKLEDIPRYNKAVVIADGATFGAYIAGVVAVAKDRDGVGMYFPESFE